MDIILGRERRRWPLEVKRAIVAETVASGEVSSVARRHGAAPSMVFAWRKQLGAPPLRQGRASTEAEASAASPDFALVSLSGSPTASGAIEVEIGREIRMRMTGCVDPALAAAVAKALATR